MKYLYLLCISFLFFACSNQLVRNNQIEYPDNNQQNDRDTVITYETNGNHGKIPNYKVVILGNGDLYFTKISKAGITGTQKNKLSEKVLNDIIQKFYEISYFELKEKYKDEIELDLLMTTDETEVITSIKIDDKFERMSRYIGNESVDNIDFVKKMNELENYILNTINVSQYFK